MLKNRRGFLLMMMSSFVALGLIAGSALADELFGVMTKADPEAKKITVVEKGTDKEVIVTITDDTEYVTKKGSSKVDFTKLAKNIEKAKAKGDKGVSIKVEHEKGVASKISNAPAKKAAPAKTNN